MVTRKPRPRKLPTIEDVDGVAPLQTWIQPKPRNILTLPTTTTTNITSELAGSSSSGSTTAVIESSSMKTLPASNVVLTSKSNDILPRRSSSLAEITITSPSRSLGSSPTMFSPQLSPSRQPLPGILPSPDSKQASAIRGSFSSTNSNSHQTVVLTSQRAQPRNLNCEICLSLASFSSDVLQCIYCNVVCHVHCLRRFQSNLAFPQRKWVCFLCIDDLDASRTHFEDQRQAQIDYQLKSNAQIVISKYYRGYRARKFYIRIYTIIVRLQIMFNIRRRKRAFMFNTQAKLRPMKLILVKCTGLVICDREAFKGMMAAAHNPHNNGNTTVTSTSNNAGHSHMDIGNSGSGNVGEGRISRSVSDQQGHGQNNGQRRLSSVSSNHGNEEKGFRSIANENIGDDDDISIQSNMTNNNKKSHNKKTNNNNKTAMKKKDYEIYILVTVIDQSRGEMIQSWRLMSSVKKITLYPNSTFDLHLDESIMLGGVSGFNTIVFTCFQKGVARDIFLGQTAIDLSENYIWRKGGVFNNLPLTKAEYEIRDNIGMEMKADYRAPPKGSITFELTAYRGMSSECGYCNATCAEDILRAIGKGANEYPGYVNALVHSVKMDSNHGSHSNHTSHSTSTVTKTSDSHHVDYTTNTSSSTASVGTATTTTTSVKSHGHGHNKVKYGTMLPLTTPFQDTHGNPMKKSWIAIAEGYIFIYSHFGDQLKLVIDLSQFFYSFQFKGKSMVIYQLSRPNYPPFIFYPMEVSEMLRWKCAFLSSIHAIKAKDTGSSGSGSSGGVISNGNSNNDKFDVSYLINDLLAMDQLKPRKVNKNGTLEPMTAHPLMKTLPSDNLAIPTHALIAPPTAETMLSTSSKAAESITASLASAAIGMNAPPVVSSSSKKGSINTTKTNSPAHKTHGIHGKSKQLSMTNEDEEDEEEFLIAKVPVASSQKSLLTYKPKENKVDLSKSMTVAIPEFNFVPDLTSKSTKNKVLASIFHHSRPPAGSTIHEAVDHDGVPPTLSRATESTRNLADMIKESYDLDDVVTNPKYQQYGEQFVSKLMTGAMADQYVKPLRTPTNRKAFGDEVSKEITPKNRRSFMVKESTNQGAHPDMNQSNAILNALIASNSK